MELFDLYDINRIRTGNTMERGNSTPSGFYRLVVHVCIISSDGKMLIQQRQPFKHGWSNMWDMSAGGSCTAGETSSQSAQREVKEELGLDISFEGVRPAMTVNFEDGFDDIYVIRHDADISELSLQTEEVQAARWADKDEILDLIDKGLFIPYHKGLIEMLFHFKDRHGTYTREDISRKGRSSK